MVDHPRLRQFVRHHGYLADFDAGELITPLGPITLPAKALHVASILVEHPGELVTREELQAKIWPEARPGDFDHELTAAVETIRAALAAAPSPASHIEVVPRTGLRFFLPVRSGQRGLNATEASQRANHAETPQPSSTVRNEYRHVILIVAAIATSVLLAWGFVAHHTTTTVMALTSYQGREVLPSLSPDGTRVVFAWDHQRPNNYDLYVKRIGDRAPTRLTSHPAQRLRAAWSPDGRSIAFLRTSSAGKFGVYLMAAQGGPERALSEINSDGALAWSPDGNWLVVANRSDIGQPTALNLFSTRNGETRQLSYPRLGWRGDHDAVFSPDGRSVAFVRSPIASSGDIYIQSLSDRLEPQGEPLRITFADKEISGCTWLPHVNEIVFSVWQGVHPSLWRIRAAGGAPPEQLDLVGQDGVTPSAATGADVLVYSRETFSSNLVAVEVPRVGDANPAVPEITVSPTEDKLPDYSPDGSKIAFVSDSAARSEIRICASEGEDCHLLISVPAPRQYSTPRWSPDGQQIVFEDRAQGTSSLWKISVRGGAPTLLLNDASNNRVPHWSRDGRWIYFASDRTGAFQVWKSPAGGGPAVQVTQKGGYYAEESADRQTLYYSKLDNGRTSVWKVPTAGGEESSVLANIQLPQDFTVGARGVYFVAYHELKDQYRLCLLSPVDGAVTTLASFNHWIGNGVAVSPDDRVVIVSHVTTGSSDLVLLKDFR